MAEWEAEGVRWEEALEVLWSTEAPRYLSASQELSRLARVALAGLYASLRSYCPPASAPLDRLLTDEAFDAEQIWQQIDLLARPLLSSLRRHLTRLSTDAPPLRIRTEGKEGPAASGARLPEEMMGAVPHVDEEKEGGGEDSGEAEEEEEEEEEEEDEDEDEDEGGGVEGSAGVVEDRFLKIKELEEYLQRDEAKEYGLSLAQHRNSNKKMAAMDKEEVEDDDDGEDKGEEEDDDDGDEDEQDGGFDVRWPPLSLFLTVMKNVF